MWVCPELEERKFKMVGQFYLKWLGLYCVFEADGNATECSACPISPMPFCVAADLAIVVWYSGLEKSLHYCYYVWFQRHNKTMCEVSQVCLEAPHISRENGQLIHGSVGIRHYTRARHCVVSDRGFGMGGDLIVAG